MEQDTYKDSKYPSPYQLQAAKNQIFAEETWGGEFHDDFKLQPGDLVCTEHWASSGFPNTDLDQLLKRHGREKIICVGLLANTCLEATARVGMGLGHHVTFMCATPPPPARPRPCMQRSTSMRRPMPMKS